MPGGELAPAFARASINDATFSPKSEFCRVMNTDAMYLDARYGKVDSLNDHLPKGEVYNNVVHTNGTYNVGRNAAKRWVKDEVKKLMKMGMSRKFAEVTVRAFINAQAVQMKKING